MSDLYEMLEGFGIDRKRLKKVLDQGDNYGSLIYAFETVTVLSAVMQLWPEEASE